MEGLPPRMRGKVISSLQCDFLSGITPACAGKSFWPCTVLPRCRDHPRVCGEKQQMIADAGKGMGSPPRMRGKAERRSKRPQNPGITPAYAGKRDLVISESGDIEDHPRVCGEKRRVRSWRALLLGSPPRMRGKDGVSGACHSPPGITPAYAGKRLKRSHSIGHFSCILCLFHSVLHRASVSGGSRAGPRAPPCLPAQNTVPV